MESRAQFKVKVSTTHRSYSQLTLLTFFLFFYKYRRRARLLWIEHMHIELGRRWLKNDGRPEIFYQVEIRIQRQRILRIRKLHERPQN